MPTIHDEVLGEIIVRRTKNARSIRIKYAANGKFTASIPSLTPLFYLKRVVRDSRDDLAKLAKASATDAYREGQAIGQLHTLAVVQSSLRDMPVIETRHNTIVTTLPPGKDIADADVQSLVRKEVERVLRKEAKAYLPKRLGQLAGEHFSYERVRFSHASGRWGSCSSNGTISLNIALMKLPPQLIDYVLVHELAHTREMNHSPQFWRLVGEYDGLYKLHRRQMKQYTPHL